MTEEGLLDRSRCEIETRSARLTDLKKVINLDAQITSLSKPTYWQDTFDRFVGRNGRYFVVAENRSGGSQVLPFIGFIVGEIRAWEFGSQPCGWILTILVSPKYQGRGVGETLFRAICSGMKNDGVVTVRTMTARDDNLNMSFFRAQGMMAGPFIELEKSLN